MRAADLRWRAATCAAGAKEAAQAAAQSSSVPFAIRLMTAGRFACCARSVTARDLYIWAGPSGPARRRRALEACAENCHKSRSQRSQRSQIIWVPLNVTGCEGAALSFADGIAGSAHAGYHDPGG